jgi:hypothetical protein
MRRSMRLLAAGERVEPIQFREKDYWKDAASEFNEIVDYVEQLRAELAETRRLLGQPGDLQASLRD